MECIPPGHHLHPASYLIAEGQWFPERDVFEFLCEQMVGDAPLLERAYYEAGTVQEEERVNPRNVQYYMYPHGDRRPPHQRGSIRYLPAMKHIPAIKQPPQYAQRPQPPQQQQQQQQQAQPPTDKPPPPTRPSPPPEEAWQRQGARHRAGQAQLR